MNPGKLFEQDFARSVPARYMVYRLRDCPGWIAQCSCPGGASPRFVPSNACDFFVFGDGILLPLELKSTKGVSFRFDCLRQAQREGLVSMTGRVGVHPGLVLNFREKGKTYFVPIATWTQLEATSEKKSINIKEVAEVGILIPSRKLRTRSRYDLVTLAYRLRGIG